VKLFMFCTECMLKNEMGEMHKMRSIQKWRYIFFVLKPYLYYFRTKSKIEFRSTCTRFSTKRAP
jgi:hypothetical protein